MNNTYTTSNGILLEFRDVTNSMVKFQSSHAEPQPPEYEAKTVTGVVEHHPHNETTLQTDEEKAQWAEYQKQLAEYNAKRIGVILVKGVVVHAAMDEWLAEQKALEIPVSSDPVERKIEWLTDWIITTKEDFEQVMLCSGRAAGMTEEKIAQIEGSFRGQMGESAGTITERITAEADRDSILTEDLVLQPALSGSVNGVRDWDTTESIRPVETTRQTIRTGSASDEGAHGDVGTNGDGARVESAEGE